MKHIDRVASLLVAALCLLGCESPSDVVYDRPTFSPVEEQPGLFRVTFGSAPEVTRGFTEDGSLLMRAFDLVPFGADWVLVSVPLSGGYAREELGVYRPALSDQMAHLVQSGDRQVLVLWKAPVPRIHGCPDSSQTDAGFPGPAPRTPSPVGLTFYALPPTIGTPVSAIPSRFTSTNTVEGAGTIRQRVRVNPAIREVDGTGTNAFGPALLPGATELIYSDGEWLWRASVADTAAAPALIGAGAYPALTADGRHLAFARPVGLDSVVQTFSIPLGLAFCVEEHVEVSAAGWEVVVRDLESGEETVVTEGLDPTYDPVNGGLVIRRDALYRVDVTSGAASPIPATTGAFNPVHSPDGAVLAFTRLTAPANSDVYFVRVTR